MRSRKPTDLRCDHERQPMGIDAHPLGFSWKNPGYSVPQTQYHLIIEGPEGSIVYDSGEKDGSFPADSSDGTSFLTSYTRYQWKVAVRTGRKSFSEFSDWDFFETADLDGKLSPAEWITSMTGKTYRTTSWESGDPGEKTSQDKALHYHGIYLGKQFTLKQPVDNITQARCYITGVGAYHLKVNGNTCSPGILSPAQTDYHSRVLYDTIDLQPFLLKENDITIILGNGRHIALYGFEKPRVICLIRITYEDGSLQEIYSDERWNSGSGPLQENSLFDGETFDAMVPVLLDQDVQVVTGYPLKSSRIPPITTDRLLPPKEIIRYDGSHIIDFGQNLSGYVEITGRQPKGTKVTLRYAELLTKQGGLNPASNRAAKALDTYIFKGSGQETWHPAFTYHGFRYVEITGWEGELETDAITAHFIHTETEQTGSFSCSHEDFNLVHEAILWGQQSNMMGIPTDSPQRDERHGWLGDALLACEQALLNFLPVGFYRKYLQDIADTQGADGSITDVAPSFWMDKPADPAWGSAFITIGYLLYRYSGDESILHEFYPLYERYIAFLDSRATAGIITDLGTFGDWCAPGLVTSKKTGLPCISTWYYLHDIDLMVRISEVLGFSERQAYYDRLKERVSQQFLNTFYDGSVIVSQEMSPWDFPDITSQVLALSLDLLSVTQQEKLASILDRLVTQSSGNHVGTGIHGTAYLLQGLCDAGYEQKAFTVASQESYPGWIYMIRNGATTLWERWELIECEGMNSHNHIMLGSIDTWFYHYIAGLASEAAGWKRIGLYPGYFPEIDSAEAQVETPYGTTSIAWKQKGDLLDLRIEIPSGTRGELHLPKGYVLVENTQHYDKEFLSCKRKSAATHTYILTPAIHCLTAGRTD